MRGKTVHQEIIPIVEGSITSVNYLDGDFLQVINAFFRISLRQHAAAIPENCQLCGIDGGSQTHGRPHPHSCKILIGNLIDPRLIQRKLIPLSGRQHGLGGIVKCTFLVNRVFTFYFKDYGSQFFEMARGGFHDRNEVELREKLVPVIHGGDMILHFFLMEIGR